MPTCIFSSSEIYDGIFRCFSYVGIERYFTKDKREIFIHEMFSIRYSKLFMIEGGNSRKNIVGQVCAVCFISLLRANRLPPSSGIRHKALLHKDDCVWNNQAFQFLVLCPAKLKISYLILALGAPIKPSLSKIANSRTWHALRVHIQSKSETYPIINQHRYFL